MTSIRRFSILLLVALLLVGCIPQDAQVTPGAGGVTRPNNAIDVSIIYAPESDLYMPQVIADFNRAYAEGRNPVTGERLAGGERPIYVTGEPGSSGTVMQGIINAFIAPNNQNVRQPVIFQPSVSHWLALANYQAGRTVFDLTQARATALAPVVMAIWESRLNAIRDTLGYNEIGWEELLNVLNSPNGWQDFGIPNGRRTVYYGHTDPFVSSTGLSTLIAEFYAAARADGFTGRRLTIDQVNDTEVQQGVRDIEQLIRHYSQRTTEFKEYIAQGPEYLDFVALEENDLIFINRGLTDYEPPERLVALYPKEGTFWHEHPMGIVNAPWVTPEQQEAARVLVDYVLLPDNQRLIMSQGFRPANPEVALEFPFVPENGIDPAQPTTVLDVPEAAVITAIQQNWELVKKQADILLVIDVSGSMSNENKLAQAQEAALAFIEGLETNNRVGLATFSDRVDLRVPIDDLERTRNQLYSQIRSLRADGGTELFQATAASVDIMNEQPDEQRIRAVIILSDGEDTGDRGFALQDALTAIAASREALNPVIVIPVAYGSDADIQTLNAIARESNTRIQAGDPDNIQRVLDLIGSYF